MKTVKQELYTSDRTVDVIQGIAALGSLVFAAITMCIVYAIVVSVTGA